MPLVVACAGLQKLAHAAELVVAVGEQLVDRLGDQLAERADEVDLQPVGHLVVVAVGGAERLGDHVVDDAELDAGRCEVSFRASAACSA